MDIYAWLSECEWIANLANVVADGFEMDVTEENLFLLARNLRALAAAIEGEVNLTNTINWKDIKNA